MKQKKEWPGCDKLVELDETPVVEPAPESDEQL
jgi:hypothetical protein